MYEFSQPNAVEYSWSWSNMAKALANFNSWICMISVGIGFFCACLTHNFLHRIGWGHFLVHHNHNSQILGEKQSLWKFNIWWWNYRPRFWPASFMFLFLFINAFFLYFLFWHKTHCIYFSIFLFIKFNAFFYDIYLQNSIILLWHIVLKWIFQNS